MISMFPGQRSSYYKRHLKSPSSNTLDVQGGQTYCWWQDQHRTLCEPNSFEQSSPSFNHEINSANPSQDQIEELRSQLEEPCRACMYTGVTVCTGLSVYFANLAIDPTTLPKNRNFLWVCSASALVAGGYRFYLG